MAVKFKVSTDKLLTTASQFEASANQWNTKISSMLNIVNGLGSSWAGPAATEFRNKFRQHDQDRNDIVKLIREHVQDLKDIATNYAGNESDISGNIGGLPVNVVHDV